MCGCYPPRALVQLAIVACMLWLLRAAPLCYSCRNTTCMRPEAGQHTQICHTKSRAGTTSAYPWRRELPGRRCRGSSASCPPW